MFPITDNDFNVPKEFNLSAFMIVRSPKILCKLFKPSNVIKACNFKRLKLPSITDKLSKLSSNLKAFKEGISKLEDEAFMLKSPPILFSLFNPLQEVKEFNDCEQEIALLDALA